MLNIRTYNPQKDRQAVHRIWQEIQWIKGEDEEKMMDAFLSEGRTLIAELNGEPECLAASVPGTFRYLEEDLKLSAVAAVTTSRIARKQGLAKQLTVKLVAADVLDGAQVSALGMFEQGFYDQLGFGSGGYEHWISFNPAYLNIKQKPRVPRRLTKDDWKIVHKSLLNRHRGHGACNLLPASIIQAEMGWTKNGFGLGYWDESQGELTHFFWGSAEDESGPYSIKAMAYQNGQQFLELMALIKTLNDQVLLVSMREPAGIQLQDLLNLPLKQRQATNKSKFENQSKASAYWQVRICDLEGCLSRTHLHRETVRFNLELYDPIELSLEQGEPWRGITGSYIVTFGHNSKAERGTEPNLPTLKSTVGAFTRLWLGVRPATGLSVTDNLIGPDSLLRALDDTLCLPDAKPDWDF